MAPRMSKSIHSPEHIKLRDSGKGFRFVTLWISKAPAAPAGAPSGHVSVNELELFPAK